MKPIYIIIIIVVLILATGMASFFWGKSTKICPTLPTVMPVIPNPGRDIRIDSLERINVIITHQNDSLKNVLHKPKHENIIDKPLPVPALVSELADYYGWPSLP